MPAIAAAVPSDSAPTSPARPNGMSLTAKLNLALAAAFWVWLAGELCFEWSVSDQYGYGLFVPFLTAYLVWLRAMDLPAPQPWGNNSATLAFAALAALAQYPIAVLFAANADWRLLAWGEALLALAVTVALLLRWGGWPWVKHFVPALILFLFAVPWPSLFQITLMDHLMTFLATVVTEILNLLGYNAVQEAHIIRMHDGSLVAVEEACSGVRSIQSTIMAGWLVGEWWRFRALGRAGLLVWAMVMAVLFNLLRTFAVAWIDAVYGPAAMGRWHDPAGYIVLVLSFTTVLGGAWLARPRIKSAPPPESPITPIVPPHWLPPGVVWVVLGLLAGAWPAGAAWYAAREPDVSGKAGWQLNLAAAAPQAKPTPPGPEVQQVLFYHEGIQAEWVDEGGRRWRLYHLQWSSARAAQLGGVHSPESCLPAVGWFMAQQGGNLDWKHGGLELIFNTYEFDTYGFGREPMRLFVFYGQWDPAGYPYFEKTGRFRGDRLLDAWQADRKQGKQLLEVAIEHADSLADATNLMRQFLDRAIVELPPGGAIK